MTVKEWIEHLNTLPQDAQMQFGVYEPQGKTTLNFQFSELIYDFTDGVISFDAFIETYPGVRKG